MDCTANGLHFILLKVIFSHPKACYIDDLLTVIFGIPVTSDFCCIFFIECRIENRLFRHTGRKTTASRFTDQRQLFAADRTIKRYSLFHTIPQYIVASALAIYPELSKSV